MREIESEKRERNDLFVCVLAAIAALSEEGIAERKTMFLFVLLILFYYSIPLSLSLCVYLHMCALTDSSPLGN